MILGKKNQLEGISSIERASVHELWEGGDSTRTFLTTEGLPRALRVDAAGTLILKDAQVSPVQVTYNVIQGEILPFACSEIATGSTASVQIWW